MTIDFDPEARLKVAKDFYNDANFSDINFQPRILAPSSAFASLKASGPSEEIEEIDIRAVRAARPMKLTTFKRQSKLCAKSYSELVCPLICKINCVILLLGIKAPPVRSFGFVIRIRMPTRASYRAQKWLRRLPLCYKSSRC